MNSKIKNKPIIMLIVILLLFYCYPLLQLLYAKLIGINVIIQNEKVTLDISDDLAVLLKILADLTFAVFLFILYRKDIIDNFKSFFKDFKRIIKISLFYWVIGLSIMAFSNILIGLVTTSGATNQDNVKSIIEASPILAIIITTIIAPFTEEIVFRKVFKDAISDKIPFILISGIAFGAIHVISSLSGPLPLLLYIIPYSALGIVFAIIYYKTDNIFSTIFIHMLHNLILVLLQILLWKDWLIWKKQE